MLVLVAPGLVVPAAPEVVVLVLPAPVDVLPLPDESDPAAEEPGAMAVPADAPCAPAPLPALLVWAVATPNASSSMGDAIHKFRMIKTPSLLFFNEFRSVKWLCGL